MDFYVINDGLNDTVFLNRGNGSFDLHYAPSLASWAGRIAVANDVLSRIHILDVNVDGFADVYRIEGRGGAQTLDSVFVGLGDGQRFKQVRGANTTVSSTPALAAFDISSIRFGDYNVSGKSLDILL